MSSFPAVTETEGDQQDEAFYAELKRQILSLTDGDDNDDCSNNDFGGRSRHRTMSCDAALQAGPRYYSLWGCDTRRNPVPAWLSNIWRDEKGTGVFIPCIVRTKQKPVRKNRRTHKRAEKKNKAAV